jgi:DNA invertase Pin-like site-specific DNA recombinase
MRIGYARVSTEEQNLGLQLDALTEAACNRIYRDEGVSAVARERPAFAAALAALERGDTLVIWKMDRAFRSLLHALQVLQELEARGVHFHSLTDAIDTGTPMGRFVYQIRNAFSELERALIVERTKAGMAAARRRGVRIGRPPKLTPEQIAQARAELSAGSATLDGLASRFSVSRRTLSRKIKKKENSHDESASPR